MTNVLNDSLTNTLVLALSQCQEQLRTIREHSASIDRLQQENSRLSKEIQDLKDDATTNVSAIDTDRTQDLFQKYVESQAENQKLRKKLKSYKEKASRRLTVPLSSPLSTPITPVPSSLKQIPTKRAFSEVLDTSPSPPHVPHTAEQEQDREVAGGSLEVVPSSPRKRAKPDRHEGRDVLKELPANVTTPTVPSKSLTAKKIAAIPLLAEDGEDHAPAGNVIEQDRRTINKDDSMYHRLDGLLATSTPTKTPLAIPQSRSPRVLELSLAPNHQTPTDVSNVQHIISENVLIPIANQQQTSRPDWRDDEGTSRTAFDAAQPKAGRKKEESTSVTKRPARSFKLVKPLRTHALSSLSLSSFKPNPRWLSSHNMSYDDFLNDRQYDRMRTLATSLPYLPGETNDRRFTDHELLLEFLGAGSESRIATLTPIAHQNLILEARTRRVAQQFKLSKPAADLDEEDGPPGFWSTDMPGTQEAEKNKEAGRQKEREEVKKRHADAMDGQGRWIFADE